VRFDGNRYCVPRRYVGRYLIVKADFSSVTIYDLVNGIVSYAQSWRRGQALGADRFEAELADLRPAARRSHAQERLFPISRRQSVPHARGLARCSSGATWRSRSSADGAQKCT
jgi:hypothetical protein